MLELILRLRITLTDWIIALQALIPFHNVLNSPKVNAIPKAGGAMAAGLSFPGCEVGSETAGTEVAVPMSVA